MSSALSIRSTAAPNCTLCGSVGQYLYRHRGDRLFGAAGSWSIRSCTARDCGLLWLDPMPLAEDIGKAYDRYYTHQAGGAETKSRLREAFRILQRAYLANAYDYRGARHTVRSRVFGRVLHALPLRKHETDLWIRSLRAVPRGRLLDVGCGSGDWLVAMRELGWSVDGVDFDVKAVQAARSRGLDVFCGALEDRRFPAAHFDAITLNHVIEHVPDPVKTLAECHRILKPGGTVVITTPNTDSLSHRLFKGDWRGLEPPRHLHMFSASSLTRAIRRAGFTSVRFRPEVVTSVIFESLSLRRGGVPTGRSLESRAVQALARFLTVCELAIVQWKPLWSDCVCAIATKHAVRMECYEGGRSRVEGPRDHRELRRQEHRLPEARHRTVPLDDDVSRHRRAERSAEEC